MKDSQITADDHRLAMDLVVSLQAMKAADAAGLVAEAGQHAQRAAEQIAELRALRAPVFAAAPARLRLN